MRVAVIGGVRTTSITIEMLVQAGFEIVGVLGYSSATPDRVSGYADIARQCQSMGLPFRTFTSINDADCVDFLAKARPDTIFAVGLSQLLKSEVLAIPRLGTVGFHPTRLPSGRGRAPMAWLVESGTSGAASFFEVTDGVDEGGILAEEPFAVYPDDHAEDAYLRMYGAMRAALGHWLPRLRAGEWAPVPQKSRGVSVWGKRTVDDGLIDWKRPAHMIDALVRAASSPHPGAYTYARDVRVSVPRSQGLYAGDTRAIPGSVLESGGDGSFVVQAGDSALRISLDCDVPNTIRVGLRLGYSVENEIHDLRLRVAQLEARLIEVASNEKTN